MMVIKINTRFCTSNDLLKKNSDYAMFDELVLHFGGEIGLPVFCTVAAFYLCQIKFGINVEKKNCHWPKK